MAVTESDITDNIDAIVARLVNVSKNKPGSNLQEPELTAAMKVPKSKDALQQALLDVLT